MELDRLLVQRFLAGLANRPEATKSSEFGAVFGPSEGGQGRQTTTVDDGSSPAQRWCLGYQRRYRIVNVS